MRPIAAALLAGAALASCRSASAKASIPADQTPKIVQPGAPGQPSRTIDAEQSRDLSHLQATPADVAFMQGMIHHHAQAVEMVELLKTRTASHDMQLLGQRIEISQQDEIKMMQHWLSARGQPAPDPMPGMPMPGMTMTMMPGMLTPAEMQRLAAAKGPAFDRLFLEGMIRHHGGALTMVHDLFATPGAGQDSEIFAFASDVDADQRMEIDRMSAMLKELQQ